MSVHSISGAACTCITTRSDPFRRQIRQRSRPRVNPPVTAFWPFTQTSKASSPAATKEAKSKLTQLAGKKYGHDLSESQKKDVRDVLKELEDLKPRETRQNELAGSSWTLLYTESTGSSGGKVGPLVGQVDQAIEQLRQPHYSQDTQDVTAAHAFVAGFPGRSAWDLHQQASARTYQS